MWRITFCVCRRPGSRPKGGGGLSTAFHGDRFHRPRWPAAKPRRGKSVLAAVGRCLSYRQKSSSLPLQAGGSRRSRDPPENRRLGNGDGRVRVLANRDWPAIGKEAVPDMATSDAESVRPDRKCGTTYCIPDLNSRGRQACIVVRGPVTSESSLAFGWRGNGRELDANCVAVRVAGFDRPPGGWTNKISWAAA
jgi:hypothetical protein